MFTPKRASILSTPNAARVTRSQSLKTKSDGTSAAAMVATAAMSPLCGTSGNHSPSLNRISLTMSSIYNDAILESYKAPLPIRINELIFQHKTRGEYLNNKNNNKNKRSQFWFVCIKMCREYGTECDNVDERPRVPERGQKAVRVEAEEVVQEHPVQ